MLKKTLLGGTVAAVALCFTAAPAMAGSNEALLKRLHEKGILSDEEFKDLMAQDAAANAAPPPAAPMAAAQTALDDKTVVHMTDRGIGFNVGPATIKFSGSVNGFYVHDDPATPSATTAVVGGVANVGGNSSSAIRNGLLPGFLKVDVTTKQGGWDVGAHFGMYPGINSTAWGALGANNGGQPTALATAGIDFRQTYMTFGKARLGEFKIGRDIGLFGSEGILNDITLLSSGTPGGNVAPGNTTLGRSGVGYSYTDFQPQITYTSPSFGGAQVTLGVFQPLNSLTAPAQGNSSPGFQGKITYDGKFGGVGLRAWVSGITQEHKTLGAGTGGLVNYTGKGLDTGAKVSAGPVTLTGYYYTAKGLGTTVLNLFDTDAFGNPRSSHGFYGQALVSLGKVSVGGSYGESSLDYANAADATANPALLDKNSSWVGQVRYGLTSWVTLIGEYVHSKAEAHNGNHAESNAIALGGILFF
ncbi:MAG: porin [Proteobacteria bacterium]|nr:porin [Pseudomonadota bacterium]